VAFLGPWLRPQAKPVGHPEDVRSTADRRNPKAFRGRSCRLATDAVEAGQPLHGPWHLTATKMMKKEGQQSTQKEPRQKKGANQKRKIKKNKGAQEEKKERSRNEQLHKRRSRQKVKNKQKGTKKKKEKNKKKKQKKKT